MCHKIAVITPTSLSALMSPNFGGHLDARNVQYGVGIGAECVLEEVTPPAAIDIGGVRR